MGSSATLGRNVSHPYRPAYPETSNVQLSTHVAPIIDGGSSFCGVPLDHGGTREYRSDDDDCYDCIAPIRCGGCTLRTSLYESTWSNVVAFSRRRQHLQVPSCNTRPMALPIRDPWVPRPDPTVLIRSRKAAATQWAFDLL
jgi:hypothetical protein